DDAVETKSRQRRRLRHLFRADVRRRQRRLEARDVHAEPRADLLVRRPEERVAAADAQVRELEAGLEAGVDRKGEIAPLQRARELFVVLALEIEILGVELPTLRYPPAQRVHADDVVLGQAEVVLEVDKRTDADD